MDTGNMGANVIGTLLKTITQEGVLYAICGY